MHIEINDHTTVRDIQQTIAHFYPYLQIQFFRKLHDKYEASSEEDIFYPALIIPERP